MPTTSEDLHYVQRAQSGDCEAFNVLVRKYQNKVRRLIGRFVADSSDVEDLTQESFIKAYRALQQFRGESAFYTWLYKISVNTAKHFLMAKKNKIISFEETETTELTDNQTPEALLMTQKMAQKVQNALDNLSPDLKTALELREFEGLSYEEIAQKMNCPIGTVRSRIFRARDLIANALKLYLDKQNPKKRWWFLK